MRKVGGKVWVDGAMSGASHCKFWAGQAYRRGWWAENSWALFFPDLMIPPVKYRLRNPFFASAHVWYQCKGIQQWSQSISKVLESKKEKK